MAEQAKVRSIQVLEEFRAALVIFLEKSGRAYDSASEDVKRTRYWIDQDQRTHWEAQLKKRTRMLEQAEAELMTARMSEFVDTPSAQQLAVRKLRRAVEDASEKLRKVKQWQRNYDNATDPIHRTLCTTRFTMEAELRKAVAWLDQAQRVLESYAQMQVDPLAAPRTSALPPLEQMLADLPAWTAPPEDSAAPGQTDSAPPTPSAS